VAKTIEETSRWIGHFDNFDKRGLPGTLNEVGADDALKQQISEHTMTHPVVLANPRPVTSPGDVFEIM
tara:strand:+ start:305 stop:508 length:204 start_codon:yes stop_codon:yes gene_type:complete